MPDRQHLHARVPPDDLLRAPFRAQQDLDSRQPAALNRVLRRECDRRVAAYMFTVNGCY